MGRLNSAPSDNSTGRLGSDFAHPLESYSKTNALQQKVSSFDTLSTQDKYNALNDFVKAGIIDKKQQIEDIKAISEGEKAKIQNDFTKSLNPLESAVNFVGENFIKPIVKSGANTVENTWYAVDSILKGKQSDAARKLQDEFNKNIDSELAAGKISQDDAYKAKIAMGKKVSGTYKQQREATKTLSEIDPTKAAADAALTYLNLGTLGGGKVAAGIVDAATNIGAKTLGKTAMNVGSSTLEGSLLGGTFGGLSSLSETGSKTKLEDALQSVGLGAAIGGGLGVLGGTVSEIFSKRASDRLAALKQQESTRKVMPDLTPEQIKSMTPQKIGVTGEPSSSNVGVKVTTPYKPGIKQISQTDKVGVRVGTPMADAEYTRQFNQLSSSYDKSMKELAQNSSNMPQTQVKVMQQLIEENHTSKLAKLDEEWNKAQFKESQSSVKQVGKPTISRTAPSGGTKIIGAEAKPAIKTQQTVKATQGAETNLGSPTTSVSSTTSTEKPISSAKGAGEQKMSGSALRIRQKAIEAKLADNYEGVSTFSKGEAKKNTADAIEHASTNYQDAKDIALGKKRGKNDMYEQAILEAVTQKAVSEGDGALLNELSMSKVNTKSSNAAKILAQRSNSLLEYDPVQAIRDIAELRKSSLEATTKVSVDSEVKAAVKEVNKTIKPPKKEAWSKLIDELRCK